ncbi:ester cyclase [Mycolicibacterium sp. P1-18]|uniref:ester cyclase n=1 Tax=Mycolicibacterium sp. P1-18 TaxID=2024615 RepID=UPI0011F2D7B7|nr:ester cyclase [Mycolicibacterium sp. P1-18]KAA0098222.1 ester cyclase [Mycolicibacterium sp. P1-18]
MTFTRRITIASLLVGAASFAVPGGPAHAEPALVRPETVVVDPGLPATRVDELTTAALRYDTFWATGDPELARAALDPAFVDRTLPPGRAQGVAGPLAASVTMRAAMPDLSCTVEQLILAGDRAVAHLHFRGTFTGEFEGVHGTGQQVDFIATDIYRVSRGRITDNWHIEDNQTLMRQLGIA